MAGWQVVDRWLGPGRWGAVRPVALGVALGGLFLLVATLADLAGIQPPERPRADIPVPADLILKLFIAPVMESSIMALLFIPFIRWPRAWTYALLVAALAIPAHAPLHWLASTWIAFGFAVMSLQYQSWYRQRWWGAAWVAIIVTHACYNGTLAAARALAR